MFIQEDKMLWIEKSRNTHTHTRTRTCTHTTIRANKQVQQGCKIQDQHTKIKCLSLHKQ